MKRTYYLQRLGQLCAVGLLLSGCLIKPRQAPTRHFVLAPIPPPEGTSATWQPLGIEVGFVKMPSYLLRDAVVVRKSATEIEYLEEALWAERLDQAFRQTLEENLLLLLASDHVFRSASERERVRVRVSVNVEQFDVDTQGRGTLFAWWRLSGPGADKGIKQGQVRLTRPGPSPRGDPQVIARTLSSLTAQFSQELEQAIQQSTQPKPH